MGEVPTGLNVQVANNSDVLPPDRDRDLRPSLTIHDILDGLLATAPSLSTVRDGEDVPIPVVHAAVAPLIDGRTWVVVLLDDTHSLYHGHRRRRGVTEALVVHCLAVAHTIVHHILHSALVAAAPAPTLGARA